MRKILQKVFEHIKSGRYGSIKVETHPGKDVIVRTETIEKFRIEDDDLIVLEFIKRVEK